MQYYILCISVYLLKRKKNKNHMRKRKKHSQDVWWVCCVTGQRAATVGESGRRCGVGGGQNHSDQMEPQIDLKRPLPQQSHMEQKRYWTTSQLLFFTWRWAALVGMSPLEHPHLTPVGRQHGEPSPRSSNSSEGLLLCSPWWEVVSGELTRWLDGSCCFIS